MSNFIEDCINGDALMSEIDDYIDNWHESESELPLYRYLGMTDKEYSLFVEDESLLAFIITAHRDKVDVREIVESQEKLAARSDNQAKSDRLKRWLEDEGLWE